jgi:hypothetical protein
MKLEHRKNGIKQALYKYRVRIWNIWDRWLEFNYKLNKNKKAILWWEFNNILEQNI